MVKCLGLELLFRSLEEYLLLTVTGRTLSCCATFLDNSTKLLLVDESLGLLVSFLLFPVLTRDGELGRLPLSLVSGTLLFDAGELDRLLSEP